MTRLFRVSLHRLKSKGKINGIGGELRGIAETKLTFELLTIRVMHIFVYV